MLSAKEIILVVYMGVSGAVQVKCLLQGTGVLPLVNPIESSATTQTENIYHIEYSAMTACTV